MNTKVQVGTKVWFWEVHYIPGGSTTVLWRDLREGKIIRIDGMYLIETCGEPESIRELYRNEFWTVSASKVKKISRLLEEAE